MTCLVFLTILTMFARYYLAFRGIQDKLNITQILNNKHIWGIMITKKVMAIKNTDNILQQTTNSIKPWKAIRKYMKTLFRMKLGHVIFLAEVKYTQRVQNICVCVCVFHACKAIMLFVRVSSDC